MSKELFEHLEKAVQLARAHEVEIDRLCLVKSDLEAIRAAGIGEQELGMPIAGNCISDISAVCGTFRGGPVAIALCDHPFIEPR